MTPRTGASLARGRSRQDYGTPTAFLDAVVARFGALDVDLAARADNAVAPRYLGPGSALSVDALAIDWRGVLEERGNAWSNPPFSDIAPWAQRCAAVRDRRAWTLLLVPASVGTAWFSAHVHDRAMVYFLSPRLAFGGCAAPYPKDLMLAAYGFGARGYECWRWNR
jgi:phage N-6-adenine-methyltransferase